MGATATGRVVGKRLKADNDLEVLHFSLSGYDRLVTTPNVWTEVSNILDFGIEGRWRELIEQTLPAMIQSSVEIIKPAEMSSMTLNSIDLASQIASGWPCSIPRLHY